MNFEPIDLSFLRDEEGNFDVDNAVAFGLVLCFGVALAFGV